MTETQWITATDPKKLLKYLHAKASERKRGLFAAACCRRVWHLLTDPRSRRAVETAERYADGEATGKELSRAEMEAQDAYSDSRLTEREAEVSAADAVYAVTVASTHVRWDIAEAAATNARAAVAAGVTPGQRRAAGQAEGAAQLLLLREIFGNPFRPMNLAPLWRTSDVMALAKGIYEERAFERMPILADALQDAGCDSDEI